MEKQIRQIVEYITSNHNKIDVKAGVCRYNFRCSFNAVHDALENDEDELAMCVYVDDEYPIIHFININKDGEYIDNTLGHWSERVDFYLVRNIKKDEFWDVNDIFTSYRNYLKTIPSWWLTIFKSYKA